MRRYTLLAVIAIGLVLGGCLRLESIPSTPELRISFGSSRNIVILEVVHGNALRYVWDFGDGNTAETTFPKVVHTYSLPGRYTVVVRGYGQANTGDGGPGPGVVDPDTLVFQLEAIVDTREALEIIGMEIIPIDPPSWYAPGTPAWPDWHFPSHTALRFRLLYRVNREGEVGILEVRWLITDAYGRVLKMWNAEEWIWYEAMSDFRVYGCPGVRTEYRVYCNVRLTDGSEVKLVQSIWACPPSGCL